MRPKQATHTHLAETRELRSVLEAALTHFQDLASQLIDDDGIYEARAIASECRAALALKEPYTGELITDIKRLLDAYRNSLELCGYRLQARHVSQAIESIP